MKENGLEYTDEYGEVLPLESLLQLFEEIKAEIIEEHCKHCEIDANIQKCLEDKFTICEVYDIIVIIDNHINKLKEI